MICEYEPIVALAESGGISRFVVDDGPTVFERNLNLMRSAANVLIILHQSQSQGWATSVPPKVRNHRPMGESRRSKNTPDETEARGG